MKAEGLIQATQFEVVVVAVVICGCKPVGHSEFLLPSSVTLGKVVIFQNNYNEHYNYARGS